TLTVWQETLRAGRHVEAWGRRLLPDTRRFLVSNTECVLVVPIGWEGGWRGFLCFEDGDSDRRWSNDEIRLLQTTAEMVGMCIDRDKAEEALRRAKANLENEVLERTQ